MNRAHVYDHVFIKFIYCNNKEKKYKKCKQKPSMKMAVTDHRFTLFMSDVKKRPDFFYETILLETLQGDFMGHEF